MRLGILGNQSFAFGGEISYQHDFGTRSFVDASIGGCRLGGTVSGSWNILFDFTDFNVYIGPGLTLGGYMHSDKASFNMGVLGQLGIEHRLGNIPLNLALEWRPTYYLAPSSHLSLGAINLAVRYRF